MEATVFDIQRFALHDGPGIRSTVFFKGCPLGCLWCANPESVSAAPEMMYNTRKCLLCGECQKNCTEHAIDISESTFKYRKEKCAGCRKCIDSCYSQAISFAGRQYSLDGLFSSLKRDRPFFDQSKGGVTLSGGEPLFQAEFVTSFAKKLRDNGIHTALDTSGFGDPEAFREIVSQLDLVIFDLKHSDPDIHKKLTGQDNRLILQNLDVACKEKVSLYISIPLIIGMNDDDTNLKATGRLINSLPNIESIRVLPYHKMGISKYEQLGKSYPLKHVEPETAEALQAKVQMIRERLSSQYQKKLTVSFL